MPASPAAIRAATAFDAPRHVEPQPVFDIGQSAGPRRSASSTTPARRGAAAPRARRRAPARTRRSRRTSAPPFLVAPNDMMSTPERQLASAGLQPSRATALANRAPSICSLRPRALATSATARDLVERIDRAKIARLGQVDRGRLAAMQLARRDRRRGFRRAAGVDPAILAGDRRKLEPAAEKPGGIGLGRVDVRLLAAIDDAPGRADRRQAQRVGGGSGRHRKHPHLRSRTIRRSRCCSRAVHSSAP